MQIRHWMTGFWAGVLCVFFFYGFGPVFANEAKDMGGWGINDPYNQLYNAADVEKIKVTVMDIKEIVPLPGMTPGIALVVKEDEDSDDILVHVCPTFYKNTRTIGIRKGEKISLRGVFTEINNEEVILAAKIKGEGKQIKVRLTSDGTPFWTMSPAQLQKELSSE